MSSTKSNDDCYFYFYSTCAKGDKCPFRHCEAALGKEVVCSLWKEGQCFRDNCQFRHMECKKNRSQIPCYWENQPGGCRKPHCVFLHVRPRSPNLSNFPEVPGAGYIGSAVQQAHLVNQQMTGMPQVQPGMEDPGSTLDTSNVTQPIEPVVVNFDDQESDTESTPTKQPLKEWHRQLDTAVICPLERKKNEEFGVKTLEQIRLERIHKESADFYETTPVAEKSFLDELEEDKQDVSAVDLRKHLKRRLCGISEDKFSDATDSERNKKFVKLNSEVEEDANFHIKTLDEIRKEKEKKKETESFHEDEKFEVEEIVKESDHHSSSIKHATIIYAENSPSKKRRINRLVQVHSLEAENNNKKENIAKNGNTKLANQDAKTDILKQLSTFTRRIIKRKSGEVKAAGEKKHKSDKLEEKNVVSCTSSGSNGLVMKSKDDASSPNFVVQQTTISSSSDLREQLENNLTLEERKDDFPTVTPNERTEEKTGAARKLRDRSTSLAVTEDDLDFLLDEDDVEDVLEMDKTDDALLQELDEIINS